MIIRLAEIIEKETEAYYKMDPDPFDDRHPGKIFFFTKSECYQLWVHVMCSLYLMRSVNVIVE